MKPKSNKKTLLIVAGLLAVGGIVGFILWKRKKDKEQTDAPPQGDVSGTPPVGDAKENAEAKKAEEVKKQANAQVIKTTNPVKTTVVVPKDAPKDVPKGNQVATLVSAVDLLAGNPTGANQKQIFAQISGLPVYNMNGKAVGKTVRGQWLGVAYKAENTKYGYKLYFVGRGGVKYYMPAVAVLVKTN